MNFSSKLNNLLEFIKSFDSIVIAFSGGVDSSTLAALCAKELDNVVAVTVVSEVVPSREIKQAKKIAEEIGIKHEFITLNLLGDQNFVKNTRERCFYCKKIILENILEFCRKNKYSVVFEGTNADELKEHRPGYKAVVSFEKVHSPWAKFGFTKDEIRYISKEMGFSFFNKPPLACLATRIPSGVKIDLEKLKMIDKAENEILKYFGLNQVRVRYLNRIAVIEVEKEDIPKFLGINIEDIVEKLKEIGFKQVFLDLEGYKSGKFNYVY